MEWQPIERGQPEVVGTDPEYQGLLNVHIPLNASPDAEWSRFFLNPTNVGIPLSLHPPRLHGRSVQIRPPDEELERYVQHVDERIAAANAHYEQVILPRQRREAEKRAQEEAEVRRRLEDARRRAEDM